MTRTLGLRAAMVGVLAAGTACAGCGAGNRRGMECIALAGGPRWFLFPAVATLSLVAVCAVNNSAFDIGLMVGFGVLGYLMRKLDFPAAPLILGLVLGPLVETNLRRALSLSGGEWTVLFSSPLAIALWLLAGAGLLLPLLLSRLAWKWIVGS